MASLHDHRGAGDDGTEGALVVDPAIVNIEETVEG